MTLISQEPLPGVTDRTQFAITHVCKINLIFI